VDRVFLSSADGPMKIAHEAAVIDACAGAGVRLVVKASTLHADPGSPLPPFAWNGMAEAHLRRSGVPAVLLRSAFYMTNLLASADGGMLVAPAGDGRVAMIDPADVAAAAAAVLADPRRAGRTYRLTGPGAITFAEAASALGLEHVDVPPEAALQAMAGAGMPDWLATHLDGAFARIRAGAFGEVTDDVRELCGREAHGIGDFAARLAADGARATA